MDFSHLLVASLVQNERLIEYGFSCQGDGKFVLKKKLDHEFYAVVSCDSKCLVAEVFENESNEKYDLLDVKSAQGSFVNGIRGKVSDLISDIEAKCFVTLDLKKDYVRWLEEELHVPGDFPFEDDDASQVFRGRNSKWFALVMRIKFKNLGFENDEPVWVVNLKSDSDVIPSLVDGRSIFPAWHMNKKHWISVLLTVATDFEKLKELTLRSRVLVEKGSR